MFHAGDGLPFHSLVATRLTTPCATYSCVPLDTTSKCSKQRHINRCRAERVKTNAHPPFPSVILPAPLHTSYKKLNNCPFTTSVSWCHSSPAPLTRFPSLQERRACFRDPISQIAATLYISFNAFFLNGFFLKLECQVLKSNAVSGMRGGVMKRTLAGSAAGLTEISGKYNNHGKKRTFRHLDLLAHYYLTVISFLTPKVALHLQGGSYTIGFCQFSWEGALFLNTCTYFL